MSRTRGTTPHLFQHWARIVKRIQASERIVLFFDFDGTLVRIAPLPGQVRLAGATRRVLQKLAAHREVRLVVISGRRRVELQRHIGIHGIEYMGLYGWERNGNARLSSPARKALFRTQSDFLEELSPYPGVWIEPKGSSFSIHHLGVSAEIQRQVRRRVRTRLRPLRETLRVITNLRDMEVAPVSIGGKGAAVRKFLGEPAHRGALAIYFGDDLSDEPAFTAVRKGISILVGERRATRAQFCLRGPAEVAAALSRVEAILR